MDFICDTLGRIARTSQGHLRAREYGERAFRILGEQVDVVYWDVGNGWSSIITIIPHDEQESQIQEFWNALMLTEDE